jgi:tetratricopeptide (TPR) repeat protein
MNAGDRLHEGLAAARAGRALHALKCFERAFRLDRSCETAGLLAVTKNIELGLFASAAQAGEQLLTSMTSDRDVVLGLLGLAYYHQGAYAAARSALVHSINLRPSAAAYNVLGVVYGKLDQIDEAKAAFQQALDLDPDDLDALLNLSDAVVNDAPVKAAALLRRALQLEPTNAMVHQRCGAALLAQGLLDDAEKSLSRALKLDPENADAHANLGRLFYRRYMEQEAEAHYQTACALAPTESWPLTMLAAFYWDCKKERLARQCSRAAIGNDPTDSYAMLQFGQILAMSGNRKQALRWLRRCVAVGSCEQDANQARELIRKLKAE